MLEIKQVTTKKQQREFLNFPLKLYKGNKCFVPPLYGDEKSMFKSGYVYHDTCEDIFFNAYRDGKMVGRIQGILQNAANKKWNQKRVRFTRFDTINDQEVATALFNAVENWGKEKGMEELVGPLGYSDQEREGLLVEGFDELSTFEEQYNYDYYEGLITSQGYKKEAEWIESKIYRPKEYDQKLKDLSQYMMKRLDLHIGKAKSMSEYLDRYSDQIFDLLDTAYSHIYGTVPFTPGVIKMLLANFKMVINLKYTMVIVDKNDKVVAFGVCCPSLSRAVQPSGGKITPACLLRILHDTKRPKILDMMLIGVVPEYEQKGVSSVMLAFLMDSLCSGEVEYCETNLNLVDNHKILNQWKRFDSVLHKRRRSYVKKL